MGIPRSRANLSLLLLPVGGYEYVDLRMGRIHGFPSRRDRFFAKELSRS
jgi:hypothetical protein